MLAKSRLSKRLNTVRAATSREESLANKAYEQIRNEILQGNPGDRRYPVAPRTRR